MSEPGKFGFMAALPKPFDPPDLVAAVRLAAARHG
jgi:DNA-binding response OmpR family regulator